MKKYLKVKRWTDPLLTEWVIHFLLCGKGKVEKQTNYLEKQMKIVLYTC